jgi:hypothetical protein
MGSRMREYHVDVLHITLQKVRRAVIELLNRKRAFERITQFMGSGKIKPTIFKHRYKLREVHVSPDLDVEVVGWREDRMLSGGHYMLSSLIRESVTFCI